ncbi:MAG: PRC-barrel domain containing protein [Desulfobacteraceae bacterium]|nr:MAG: PRC-barrel domain containing protein [Desulfobacteraceae bacterium]
MKKATIIFIASAALAFAIPLYAGDGPGMKSDSQQKTGYTQHQTGKMHSGQRITADELQGMDVVSQEGKEIGEIEKITIDKQSGKVQFVTFSTSGFLGMGTTEIAAPLSAFDIRDDKARLNVDQSKLKNVPNRKAKATDSDYLRDLETHYGVAPAWNQGEESSDNLNNQPIDNDSTDSPTNIQ